ncbi:phenylacetate--CoA ligase [Sphaerisporangium krabiense]|uniref:Phenylacetate-CoA ligase n=1 Tax=Sphaerisporangium krabiense TaxID=763782 RepID=A0A7W8Z2M0_9ACTN|nr:phenylacetate--CoA ligase family protein [Sphaerisporangium krabiense]MBB5626294.1 phenylacetate-CoA ligase [Sphaerisporangium krabiense]GII66041.1 phenylacetate--CoA ligase [Sphaerisporangium krabiense]
MIDEDRPARVLAGLREFYQTPPPVTSRRGAEAALALFHDVAATVPAYADFLREKGVDPAAIRTVEDFARVPLLDKDSYHRRHPLPRLCRHGRLDACDMVAVSSGSSGAPTVWPRSVLDERLVAARFEQVFRDAFHAGERTTLAVICFALGTWVGGMYTAACCRHLAAKGYPITVATPGNDIGEILRVVGELGPHFDQVVLLGYPPFVKNVVDAGLAQGVDWPARHVKMVLAGEVFSEQWRDLVGRRAGMTDPCHDSASLYGTADAGVLGTETPLSVRARRFLAGRPDAARELFGDSRLPTLVQYDPESRYFETRDGTLLFTGDNGVPLIRYHIADEGGVVPFDAMLEFCRAHGFDPAAGHGPGEAVPELPFVYVFGRSMFTVSFFGANVYPENVTVGLERADIGEKVTGKFVLRAEEDADRDRRLSVVVELAPGVRPDPALVPVIAASIRTELLRLNSEFAHYVPPEHQTPAVELRETGDPEYFPPGVKHRYTRPA